MRVMRVGLASDEGSRSLERGREAKEEGGGREGGGNEGRGRKDGREGGREKSGRRNGAVN